MTILSAWAELGIYTIAIGKVYDYFLNWKKTSSFIFVSKEIPLDFAPSIQVPSKEKYYWFN